MDKRYEQLFRGCNRMCRGWDFLNPRSVFRKSITVSTVPLSHTGLRLPHLLHLTISRQPSLGIISAKRFLKDASHMDTM